MAVFPETRRPFRFASSDARATRVAPHHRQRRWSGAGPLVASLVVLLLSLSSQASTQGVIRTAASCSQTDVAAAISAASHGHTVQVPAGTCNWSGLSISKAIHLRGAGVGQTRITLAGNNSVTKQSAGITRISDFSFTRSGGGNGSKGWTVGGSWLGAEPVIFTANDYTISGAGLFRINVAGGVIIANSNFVGGNDDSFIQPKDDQDSGNSWGTAHTIGTADTTGKRNLYIENNTFLGGTNQGIDCDDAARCVVRYNTFDRSSFNSHGWDTSAAGVRHWEVYNNTFKHPGGSCTTALCNQSWLLLMRGGTGVITDNQFVDIAGSHWGNKTELHFWVRGAEDARPQGSCSNVRYPVPRQIGQNHNGTAYFTDPIRIWNNTGAQVISAGWNFGNPCGLNFDDFWQLGRDYAMSARPGYAKFAYPHPLLGGGGTQPPAPPTNVRIIR
jgi:hypothetical protein